MAKAHGECGEEVFAQVEEFEVLELRGRVG